MKTIGLILLTVFTIGCTKEITVEPIKYNTLIIGGWKECQPFNIIFIDQLSVDMQNDLEEGIFFRIEDPVSGNLYSINDMTMPANYCSIRILKNDMLTYYHQHFITLTVEVFNDSIYQGIITGMVNNGPNVLNIEYNFKFMIEDNND